MTLPTLHAPHKDSPETVLAVAIDEDDTTLVVDDNTAFDLANITRLTLGIDTPITETVTVVSYEAGPSGDMDIIVTRGNPAYSWPEGTLIARVFTSYDLAEVQEYLEELNTNMVTNGDTHDHAGGDGAQIPTTGIENLAVTADKLATDAVITAKILNANVTADKLAIDAVIESKIENLAVTADKLAANAVITEKILDSAVTPAKIAVRYRSMALPIMSYIDPLDSSAASPWFRPWSTSAYFGVMLPANKVMAAGSWGIIPNDYISDGILYPIVNTFLGYTTGYHTYLSYLVAIGSVGNHVDAKTNSNECEWAGQIPVPGAMGRYTFLDTLDVNNLPIGLSLPETAVAGDIMTIGFNRLGDNVLDTYTSTLVIRGFAFTYIADS